MRRTAHPGTMLALAAAVLALLAASACGGGSSDSASDKAKQQACDARADIQTQITNLGNLPLNLDSVDKAKTALTAIQTDLNTIKDAAPKVGGDLQKQLETANAAFVNAVQTVVSNISTATDLTTVASNLTAAASQLQSGYQQAFGDVKC
jgi:C4-dicarboxylate-specific signal transduction histidine kinase